MQELLNKLLLGNTKLAGMRTIIINTIMLLIAGWEFATKDGGLFTFLCDNIQFMCNFSSTQFYVTAMVVLAALNNILRFLTTEPVGMQSNPARLKFTMISPNAGQVIAVGAVILSLLVIGYLIVRAFI